jgi:hypothetical protein
MFMYATPVSIGTSGENYLKTGLPDCQEIRRYSSVAQVIALPLREGAIWIKSMYWPAAAEMIVEKTVSAYLSYYSRDFCTHRKTGKSRQENTDKRVKKILRFVDKIYKMDSYFLICCLTLQ